MREAIHIKGKDRRTLRYTRIQNGRRSMIVTKDVKRKIVDPSDPLGKAKLERKATLSFPVIDLTEVDSWDIQAIDICGGDNILAAKVFNQGISSFLRQQTTNELGRADEVTRTINKMMSALKTLSTFRGKTEETIRKSLMANPELAATLVQPKFEKDVVVTIDDFPAACLKEVDGKKVSRFPDVTKGTEDSEDSEDETESEK